MTRDDHIKIIREACIKANPERKWQSWYERDTLDGEDRVTTDLPCRLTDVLLAIPKDIAINNSGYIIFDDVDGYDGAYSKENHWNLRDGNLEAQSDETLAFISGLLKEHDFKENN